MNDDEVLLEKLRDDYGQLRITEAEGYRFLYFGEQTEQSCTFVAEPAWLEYDYTRAMLLGCFWQSTPRDTLILGLGGGALANCLIEHFRTEKLTAIELRPAVVELASRWLGLTQDDRFYVGIGCAESYVRSAPSSCDLLFMDLYMEGGISRLQMQKDFFQACHRTLRPGGVMVINQWQMGETGQPYASRLLEDLFGDQYLQVAVEEGNILLFVPASGTLGLDRVGMLNWADQLEPQLGYSLRPYIQLLRRANEAPPL
ncbi:methyltransferase domain-containing protein [Pseudomonas sp. OIL-1]|uniref:spermine/spermidine synthase domain-containing protein n=1 Tax=Pseudomonas sp. OIL-1 TaxID=2706126 RepID=UPI0013A7B16C|nr:methyltransferase domain-containing protein [Pseudomonas sp. OIL-1]QIB51923.1 methyltransferase domain-containing protein [Pseudomonas sp. OIL-1]